MKLTIALLVLILVNPVTSVFSQTTISYDAVVTSSSGVDAAAFTAGEETIISYTLNPGVADLNIDPQAGIFPSAVLSMSVSFPDIGISAVAGAAGNAQTFNNAVDWSGSGKWSDQVFIFGGPISSASSIDGALITSIEVDFLSDFLTPPDEPTMLSSDALPLFKLPTNDAFVIIRTSNGSTFVHFDALVTPEEQVDSIITTIEEMVADGILKSNQANGLIRPLLNVLRSLEKGKVAAACSQLYDFEMEVYEKVLDGVLTSEEGDDLFDMAESIRLDIGC